MKFSWGIFKHWKGYVRYQIAGVTFIPIVLAHLAQKMNMSASSLDTNISFSSFAEHGHSLEGGCCHQSRIFLQLFTAPVLAGVTQVLPDHFEHFGVACPCPQKVTPAEGRGLVLHLTWVLSSSTRSSVPIWDLAFTPWLLSISWAYMMPHLAFQVDDFTYEKNIYAVLITLEGRCVSTFT